MPSSNFVHCLMPQWLYQFLKLFPISLVSAIDSLSHKNKCPRR